MRRLERLQGRLQKISGPLTSFQARQIFSDLLAVNLSLIDRPVFRSEFSTDKQYSITAIVPQRAELNEEQANILGADLLAFYAEKLFNPGIEDKEQILKEIGARKRNFLWNDKDQFINLAKPKYEIHIR